LHLLDVDVSVVIVSQAQIAASARLHLIPRDRAVAVSIEGQHQPDILFCSLKGRIPALGPPGRRCAATQSTQRREHEDALPAARKRRGAL